MADKNGQAAPSAANVPLLKVTDVQTAYGKIEAIRGISFVVKQGEIVTLIGANGAGKSTTLKTISGLLHPKSGTIEFKGENISGTPAHVVTKKRIVQVPEGRRIFSRMTVMENLEMGAFLRRDRDAIKEDLDGVFELFPRLKDRIAQKGGTLSGGEQQMLAVGRAMMARPELLMLDEPSMGLAPVVVEQIFDTIVKLNKTGITVLLVEQNAHMALSIADRGYVLETGKITLEGAGHELLTNDEVRKAYLGES
jgi:branched-chain amino acid transport system ATP-binding protein